MKKTLLIATLFLGGALGAGATYALMRNDTPAAILKPKSTDLRAIGAHGETLTNPLLECTELPENITEARLSDLQSQIASLIEAHTKVGSITYASVYFRDLNNGPWFGINESDKFFPASLLKVPLAMSFYWRADSEPGVMDQKVKYTPDPSLNTTTQPFGPEKNIEAGKSYTVRELIRYMLQESSNEAAVALSGIAGMEQIDSVYRDLGMTLPQSGQDYSIDTHQYASFFRILYNATYVDRTSSEAILGMLSRTSFTDGLVAGVPQGTTVSHKFGSRAVGASGKVQLHDCGIVYLPGKPYLICVMTQGSDFTKLAAFIRDVSKVAFDSMK